LLLESTALAQHQIVCSDEAAGGYAAFPDVCRLQNGDLYCVFYSGYGHVEYSVDASKILPMNFSACSASPTIPRSKSLLGMIAP
jgi:hypothetical protein